MIVVGELGGLVDVGSFEGKVSSANWMTLRKVIMSRTQNIPGQNGLWIYSPVVALLVSARLLAFCFRPLQLPEHLHQLEPAFYFLPLHVGRSTKAYKRSALTRGLDTYLLERLWRVHSSHSKKTAAVSSEVPGCA